MKINNSIISSLDALAANFDFTEVWYKKDIAMRDLSPLSIWYPDDEMRLFYKALCEADTTKIEHDKIVFSDGNTVSASLDSNEANIIGKLKPQEQVQVIALYRLAKQTIGAEVTECLCSETSSDKVLVLKPGQSIKCAPINKSSGVKLSHKLIQLSPSANKGSFVGNYMLSPDHARYTFGVFQGNTLVDVAPPTAENDAYTLIYEDTGKQVLLVVRDRSTGNVCATYDKAHYYAMLGATDFIVIDNITVTCYKTADLNSRLKQHICAYKCPEIVKIDGKDVVVTYENITKQSLKL